MAAIVGGVAYVKLYRAQPARVFASDEDHFLFGSIRHRTASMAFPTGSGSCCRASFPSTCRARAGTRHFGLAGRQGQEMPVGLSKVTIGYPRVGINCALCHTARWRVAVRRHPPTIVPAGAGASDGRAGLPSFPDCLRVGRALQGRQRSLERSRRTIGCRCSIVLLYRFVIIPFDAAARCWRSSATGRVDARSARTGARPGGCGQRC